MRPAGAGAAGAVVQAGRRGASRDAGDEAREQQWEAEARGRACDAARSSGAAARHAGAHPTGRAGDLGIGKPGHALAGGGDWRGSWGVPRRGRIRRREQRGRGEG